jgi:uncharacterized protein YjaG (DUF416 family)
MINKLLKNITLLMVIIGTVGCTNEVKQKNVTEKVVMQKENVLSEKYLKQLSIISGRLDGMNRAIVQGLSETLDTARLAREMAESAIALAEKNLRLLNELQSQTGDGELADAGEGEEEAGEGEEDF